MLHVLATRMQNPAQAPVGWLSWISIMCQDWLISPAPIWIHKAIAMGYVCGKAIGLLNQRSHLSNKQELVQWDPSQIVQAA